MPWLESLLFGALLLQPPADLAGLDTVVLRSGGELRGTVSVIKDAGNGRSYVLIKQPSGATLKLDQAKLVRRVEKFDSVDAAYQSRLRELPVTADAHRQMIEWCQEQKSGRKRFAGQIKYHAAEVIKQAPNDEVARRVLGFDQDEDGIWVLKDRRLGGHGYVKDGTSWLPAVTMAREAQKLDRRAELGQRKEKWGRWLRAAQRRSTERRSAEIPELQRELSSFCDELAIDIVFKGARKEDDSMIRALCIESIGRVPTDQAVGSLVVFAVTDPDLAIREQAIVQLGQPHYDQAYASRRLVEFFGSKNNRWLENAAFAIGELGGEVAIPDLINHLVTSQTIKISDMQPGQLNPVFRSDGRSGLSTGGGPTTANVNKANPRVLNALRKLTGQDFELDADGWMEWYIRATTHYDVNVRSDP